ncbi:MAG: 4-alpha-glucanotransferase [Vicinamibacterales bacterium]
MSQPGRRCGVMIPLFSAPSTRSWGCGEIGDIAPLTRWLSAAGQRLLQLLPLNEMAPGDCSPYSAMSAAAIDPIYISLSDVPEFLDAGGEASLTDDDRACLAELRRSTRVPYRVLRPLKLRTLTAAFDRFVDAEWTKQTPRAAALAAYVRDESWWLDDYATFRVLHDREGGRLWLEWPEQLKQRDADALARVRTDAWRDVLFYQYLQWTASTQWATARRAAADAGVALFGDLPFMVDLHSADVWANQDSFHLDRSVGVPPDAFSATGQDWGMPAYDWEALQAGGFGWLRDRARRAAQLFDGYRVDHLVGFYRTYSRRRSDREDARFAPSEQPDQLRLGERVLRVFRAQGSDVIAEDLGVIPDFVRASLALLGVPGFRVFRWERAWHEHGQPFRDPTEYPVVSVATTGTHDTEPLAVWWDHAPEDERRAILAIPSVRRLTMSNDLTWAPFNPQVRDVLIEALCASASRIVILPVQDVFGWYDRINQPATVSEANWTYRLPWPVDTLDEQSEARERQLSLHTWSARHAR